MKIEIPDIHGVGHEIDFENFQSIFMNCDCMDALRRMPDDSIELAIVDPPYGAGLTENGGCKGWFAKYHQNGVDSIDRQTDRQTEQRSANGSTGTKRHLTFGLRKNDRNYEIKRQQAKEQSKKSYRGTRPRKENTSRNSFASHEIKSSGEEIILNCRRQSVLSYGES